MNMGSLPRPLIQCSEPEDPENTKFRGSWVVRVHGWADNYRLKVTGAWSNFLKHALHLTVHGQSFEAVSSSEDTYSMQLGTRVGDKHKHGLHTHTHGR